MSLGTGLSIAIEYPGDLLLTVTESFSKFYVSGPRKVEKVVVPCALARMSLRHCLALGELGV